MAMIKTVYRLGGDQVITFDDVGDPLRQFDGLFAFVKERVLENLREDAEFYIATWGQGNFDKVNKEQWLSYVRKDE